MIFNFYALSLWGIGGWKVEMEWLEFWRRKKEWLGIGIRSFTEESNCGSFSETISIGGRSLIITLEDWAYPNFIFNWLKHKGEVLLIWFIYTLLVEFGDVYHLFVLYVIF